MQWIEPKIDWTINDYINIEDFNRIKNNLLYLYEISKKYYFYKLSYPSIVDVNYRSYAYSDIWNQLERNLEDIIKNTYRLPSLGEMKLFIGGDPYIDYMELNRLENACLRYYNLFNSLGSTTKTLSFTLGGDNDIKE